jgi:hypothetical protein
MAQPAASAPNGIRISGGSSCAPHLVIESDVLIGIDALGLVVLRPGAVAA